VHTSTEALREAEARISAIQTRLVQQGRFEQQAGANAEAAAQAAFFS
jgi:hypothetical protein